MSYAIHLFHPTVKELTKQGRELDEVERAAFEPATISAFLDRLARYGYSPVQATPFGQEFTKSVDNCPIQVLVSSSEITFSVPYAPNASEAIFSALQDASELTDRGDVALFNPQEGSWLEV
ncbi:MAG: hypothetical protein ACRYF7_04770 [Janthinobacterium lividum]